MQVKNYVRNTRRELGLARELRRFKERKTAARGSQETERPGVRPFPGPPARPEPLRNSGRARETAGTCDENGAQVIRNKCHHGADSEVQ